MRKLIYIFLVAVLLNGCATMSLSKIASNNKNNLSKLSIGMSEQEVLNIMGTKKIRSPIWNFYTVINNPYSSAIIQTQSEKTVKILYYFTDPIENAAAWEKHSITNNELTPLVFEDGKFIGLGLDLLNSIPQE